MRNPYKVLLGLLPQKPLLVGDVVSIADGVAIIQLVDGAIVTARGNATAGEHVFVRDGLIEGSAPDLPTYVVEV
jgi:hypothetical protein